MKKQRIKKTVRMIPVLAAMALAVMIVLPVQAAPNKAADYAAVFDSTYYAENNPDLQAVFGNDSSALLNHFITCGMAEGRQGSAEFNVQFYKNNNPDLQAAFGEDLAVYYAHYMTCGKQEGRAGNGEAPGNTPSGSSSGNSSSNSQPAVNTVPVSASQASAGEAEFANEVLNLVNQVRAENGLGALTSTPQLADTAQLRAQETSVLFSHTRPDGTQCYTAFDQNGVKYGYVGENIAAGQRTPQSVMNSWLGSTMHRANILNANFKHMGVGCYVTNGGYGIYWTQCFTD